MLSQKLKNFKEAQIVTNSDINHVVILAKIMEERIEELERTLLLCHTALSNYGKHPIIDGAIFKLLNK